MTENDQKISPKFQTEFISKETPDDPRLEILKQWCSEFHEHDLAPLYENGSYGNLSFRVKKGSEEFIITASGLKLKENLFNDCFVTVSNVDLNNKTIHASGLKLPSSESMLHFAIYKQRSDINAIFHGHNQLILDKCGSLSLPATKYRAAYGTIDLVNSVIDILDDNNFIIIKDHGFISLGKDIDSAGRLALKVLKQQTPQ